MNAEGFKQIVRWEIMRNLRNKQFIIGLLITPLIFLVFAAVPTLMQKLDSPKERRFGVVDQIGGYEILLGHIDDETIRILSEADEAAAEERVRSGDIEAYFVLDQDFVNSGVASLVSEEGDKSAPGALRAGLTQLLQQTRIAEAGLDPADVSYVTAQANLAPRALAEDRAATGGFDPRRMATAIGVAVLLVILIMSSGTMLLQSALQEKRDRMSEVVLSSIDPPTLMGGKVVGHLILGLLQIAAWALIGLPAATLLLDVPILEWIAWDLLPVGALLFLLGYLFFAALFVGVGATMEDIQSAGNAQGMVFMLPFTGMIFIGPVINNSEGVVALIGSLVPLTSPLVISLRMAMGNVPTWEIALGVAILLVSTVFVVVLAARLFRVGMLMYGKSATPREIWRWLRHG